MIESTEPDDGMPQQASQPSRSSRTVRYAIEVGVGLSLAALVLWAITAAGGDVTFVYQGL